MRGGVSNTIGSKWGEMSMMQRIFASNFNNLSKKVFQRCKAKPPCGGPETKAPRISYGSCPKHWFSTNPSPASKTTFLLLG